MRKLDNGKLKLDMRDRLPVAVPGQVFKQTKKLVHRTLKPSFPLVSPNSSPADNGT
jgi:hypothetical protein